MVATRRSGSRSTVTVTRVHVGRVHVVQVETVNLSPNQPASISGAGMGMSPEACMVESDRFPLAAQSTFPFNR